MSGGVAELAIVRRAGAPPAVDNTGAAASPEAREQHSTASIGSAPAGLETIPEIPEAAAVECGPLAGQELASLYGLAVGATICFADIIR